jgi:hypothetical protein
MPFMEQALSGFAKGTLICAAYLMLQAKAVEGGGSAGVMSTQAQQTSVLLA